MPARNTSSRTDQRCTEVAVRHVGLADEDVTGDDVWIRDAVERTLIHFVTRHDCDEVMRQRYAG